MGTLAFFTNWKQYQLIGLKIKLFIRGSVFAVNSSIFHIDKMEAENHRGRGANKQVFISYGHIGKC